MWQTHSPRIDLPNLKLLGTSWQAIKGVPKTIFCPNVEELIIYNPRRHEEIGIKDLVLPLPPDYFPWPKLHSLITNTTPRDAAYILCALPTITFFTCFEDKYCDWETDYVGRDVVRFLERCPDILPNLVLLKMEPTRQANSEFPWDIVEAMGHMWEVRPSLMVECTRDYSDNELAQFGIDNTKEEYPDQFTIIKGSHGTLDHLYTVMSDVKAGVVEDEGDGDMEEVEVVSETMAGWGQTRIIKRRKGEALPANVVYPDEFDEEGESGGDEWWNSG